MSCMTMCFDIFRLRIICNPQYSNIDGSIEAMNFKLEKFLYEPKKKPSVFDDYYNPYLEIAYHDQNSREWPDGKSCEYYRATKTEGQFRFEAVDESVQVTVIDGSGSTHSQFFKDGNPRNCNICDAEDITFEMKGGLSQDLKVVLLFKILHFTENMSQNF